MEIQKTFWDERCDCYQTQDQKDNLILVQCDQFKQQNLEDILKPLESFPSDWMKPNHQNSFVPLPDPIFQIQNCFFNQNSFVETTDNSEKTYQNSCSPTEQIDTSINKSYKNFLVLFSGWVHQHFVNLLCKKKISQQTFNVFGKIVNIRRQSRQNDGKIYINLSKLSNLFSDQITRPIIGDFLDIYFLRVLASSKVKNKENIVRILPILKQGFNNGYITYLR